jgi:hypothetical protein
VKSFRIQHVAVTPRGFQVKTKRSGAHLLRIAFPPGRRRKGSGQLVEILHPKRENPARCNPAELLVLGNPKKNPAELLVLGNPSQGERAGELYEEFHQAKPGQFGEDQVLELDEEQPMPKHTAVLGDLKALGLDDREEYGDGHHLSSDEMVDGWRHCSRISFAERDVKLAADPSGGQLYCVGGDQELSSSDLEQMGAVRRGDEFLIGPAVFIVYNARKMNQGGSYDGYVHTFGERGGRRPTIYYDPEIERIILRGGSYRVEGVGIVN